MDCIPRPEYLDHIVRLLNRNVMLFLIGQRRVGKSFILRQLKQWLMDNRPSANIIYINKEYAGSDEIVTSKDLYLYAANLLPEGEENYLLIDEVQDIEGFENALRSLHAEERCQIVATGSNAYIFSSELATRMGGRYIEIPIYNLSYREFLEFHQLEDSDSALMDFLRVGGLPCLRHFDISDEIQVKDYLFGVYNTIMLQDVVSRKKIRNTTFVKKLSFYLADNIGKLFSIRNIANQMKSQGDNASAQITSNYMECLVNSLLIHEVSRYDVHGKKLLEQIEKYYFSDHGLRNLLSGFNMRGSIEKIMENVVYLHLLQRGYDVTVGILRAGEIDFVAAKADRRLYIQVSYLLASDETIRREFGTLAAIPDNYPKYVVSMDPVGGSLPEYPGIIHLTLRAFLLSEIF